MTDYKFNQFTAAEIQAMKLQAEEDGYSKDFIVVRDYAKLSVTELQDRKQQLEHLNSIDAHNLMVNLESGRTYGGRST